MLTELHIRDFAIIDELDLFFAQGFTVLTGETGAGKSIIIDAVELLLGGRADVTQVRADRETAWVEGGFLIPDGVRDVVHDLLSREDLLDDPEYLTLGREVRKEGRNVCRVNGRTVNLSLLRELGNHLVDVHGQSEHLSLLRVSEHLELLDRYANVEGLRAAYESVYHRLQQTRDELDRLLSAERDAAHRVELLNYQVEEIEAAAPQPDEESQLRDERNRLANAEQITTLSEKAIGALDGEQRDQESAADQLGKVADDLLSLSKVDPSTGEIQLEAQALMENISDLARRLRIYREGIEFNPTRLDEVEERLGLLQDLKRKYGGDLQAVLLHAENARSELQAISTAEGRINELESELEESLDQLGELGIQLSASRREAGTQLAQAIEEELKDLHMEQSEFEVQILWTDDPLGVQIEERRLAFDNTGLDSVEFLVAPNPGEGLKPLVKIASGGETSRLMLGLKGVLARADRTPTLIFDEIDQGIGGRVGAIVGRKLWDLGRTHQVLCITHLPQLAACGEAHYKVDKSIRDGRTATEVTPLSESEIQTELASMMGEVSETNLVSASELLAQAASVKGSVSNT